MRNTAYRLFAEKSGFEEAARDRFGSTPVFADAIEVGRALGRIADRGMLDSDGYADSLRDLVLAVAPSKMIVDRLAQVADGADPPDLGVISSLFGDAKIAEMASMGQTAAVRVRALGRLESAIRDTPDPDESEMQKILEEAPWLINPQWTILQSNSTLKNFKNVFESWYAKRHGGDGETAAVVGGERKRPDFILVSASDSVEIVEIKKPRHKLDAGEFERLRKYLESMTKFIEDNRDVAPGATGCRLTLIYDGVDLKGMANDSFKYRTKKGQLVTKTWEELLSGARRAHEDFIRFRDESSGAGGPE